MSVSIVACRFCCIREFAGIGSSVSGNANMEEGCKECHATRVSDEARSHFTSHVDASVFSVTYRQGVEYIEMIE